MPPVRTETHERMKAALQGLRLIHHKYAARVAHQATLLHLTAKKLHALQRALEKEATAAAGKGYREWRDVGYDEHGPLAEQTERGELPTGPGLVDIVDTARAIALYAGRVAGEAVAPALPSE
jgi:hypothetical protein